MRSGLRSLEVHVTLSREMFGPDVPSSVTTAELGQLVAGRSLHRGQHSRHPVDKDARRGRPPAAAGSVHEERGRRASTCRPERAARVDDLAIKKPGTGIPADRLADCLTAVASTRRSCWPPTTLLAGGGSRGRAHDAAKICVVVTARPSYSRIKTALRRDPDASGPRAAARGRGVGAARSLRQRRATTSSDDGFDDRGARLHGARRARTSTSMAKTTGLGLLELATVFDNLQPDVVVTVADRYETLATAVAASYMNIPVAHVQGGEVTGSIDEKVRHAVTKLSDLHFVSTARPPSASSEWARNPRPVFVTGCPSIDLAAEVLRSPALDFDPLRTLRRRRRRPVDLSSGYVVVHAAPGDDRVRREPRQHATRR